MLLKKIWRSFLKKYENSAMHVFVSSCLSKIEFEGFVLTYSQFGEDIILENFFRGQKSGFYVDVGANRPVQGSNTFKLYLKGWSGINIDGNSGLIEKFKKVRKRDLSLCEIVSDKTDPVRFYISDDDRVSTVSGAFKEWIKDSRDYSGEVTIVPKSLATILDEHLPQGKTIDFLSVDVEGHDYEVLLSNNFEKYRPRVICIEEHGFSFENYAEGNIYKFLVSKDYRLKAFAYPNMFFEDSQNMTQIV
jgi:FkbM family methyltransferase